MRLKRRFIIIGAIGALVAVIAAGTALAQTPTPTPGQAKTNYQSFFLDRLAAALGTTRDKLEAAFTQARNETVDHAVKDGKLTQQQADKIKSRQTPIGPGFGFARGKPFAGHPGFGGFMGFLGNSDVRNAVAQALGMSADDLTSQLRSGKTLGELAQGKEQAVRDAIVNTIKPKLDQQVKDGKLTQDKENKIIDQVQKMDLNKMGHPGMMGRPGWNGRGNGAQRAKPSMGRAPSAGGTL